MFLSIVSETHENFSCAVGYDGQNVWCLPRAHRAITKRYNLIDSTRRSPTYEVRLEKYSKRGYRVLVPGLDRSQIDPAIYHKVYNSLGYCYGAEFSEEIHSSAWFGASAMAGSYCSCWYQKAPSNRTCSEIFIAPF